MAQSFGIATFRFLFFLSILLLLLQTQSTDAANTVIWKNHCDYDLYFWAVPPGGPERNDAFTRVPARGEHIHQMIWHKDGGIVLKYRDVPYYTRAPAGILQAEYYMDRRENKLWYDSSIIDCDRGLGPQNPYYCPFAHGGVNMYVIGNRGGNPFCKDSSCQLGGQCDEATYLVPGGWVGEPTLSCPLGVDLVFETCTKRYVEKTWVKGQVGPAPAPVPAPWQPQPAPVQPPLPPPAPWISHSIPGTTVLTSSINKATASFVVVPTRLTRPLKPQTFPVPQGYPEGTICFDPGCRCYAFSGPRRPGRADCTGFEGALECILGKDCGTWRQTERRRRQEWQ
ncbi:hypothetical protein DPSP01_003032 [Paraphaeosphaeria sporulosa]